MISSAMPLFGPDHGSTFSVSSAEWHDSAYHNTSRRLHCRRLTPQIEEMQTAIPTAKTMKMDTFLEHLRPVLAAFLILFDHYMDERYTRWQTYHHEQRAMHKFCMRVKGNQQSKKEQVVVAYGGRKFGSSMKVKRGAPVKKLAKTLRKYVTVVQVDEFRTSRVCSNRCMYKRLDLGFESENADEDMVDEPEWNLGEEDEGGGDDREEREREEEKAARGSDVIPMRGQKDAAGRAGPSLHSVRYCQMCHTVWNRDVNAARNIAWVFWWMRTHGGCRPVGFRRVSGGGG